MEDERSTDEELLLAAIALVKSIETDGLDFVPCVAAVYDALKQAEARPTPAEKAIPALSGWAFALLRR
jgi:hypothetical protein